MVGRIRWRLGSNASSWPGATFAARMKVPMNTRAGRRKRLLALVVGVVALSAMTAIATTDAGDEVDYGADGPYPTARIDSSVVDEANGRSVDVITIFPSDDGVAVASSAGRCPIVVLSHGFLLRGENYLSYAERLASHGFIVGLPTYVESILNIDHSALAADLIRVIGHFAEANAIEGNPFYERIDMSKLALMGHSLGGKISLLVAARDSGVAACALLDPVDSAPFGDDDGDYARFPSVTPELMPNVSAPLLLIGAELGGEPVVVLGCAPSEDNYEQYFEFAEAPAIEVTQIGAGHMQYVDAPIPTFIERSCAPGIADADMVRESAAAYATAFLVWRLHDDLGAQGWLERRFQEDEADGLIVVRRKE
jgi:pimeloyl-ACP methyl ester carboxylesterase